MKLEKKHIIGIAAAALGTVVIGKLVHDIRKIKKLTAEKEEAIAAEADEILADDEITEETAEEVVEETASEEAVEETAAEDAPVEEKAAPEAEAIEE